MVTSTSFKATESILREKGLPIAGFASISYRLSAHPNHPQDPINTDPKDFQDAKHPGHIDDVEAALAFLQNTYGFGGRYILVGHSCGATLAFQAVMGAVSGHREEAPTGSGSPGPLPPPLPLSAWRVSTICDACGIRMLISQLTRSLLRGLSGRMRCSGMVYRRRG